LTAESAANWVVACSTVVLVVITAFYAVSTHKILGETRRQVTLALGQDARALEVKRRRLLLIGRRVESLLSDMIKAGPSKARLWTVEEIRQLEALLPDFPEVHLNDASSVVWSLTQIRYWLVEVWEGPLGGKSSPSFLLRVGGVDLPTEATETRNRLLGIMDTVEAELNRTAS
jgi:hypothetical protein